METKNLTNKNEHLTDEEFRKINFLKEIKLQLCDNCQKIVREVIYEIVDS